MSYNDETAAKQAFIQEQQALKQQQASYCTSGIAGQTRSTIPEDSNLGLAQKIFDLLVFATPAQRVSSIKAVIAIYGLDVR